MAQTPIGYRLREGRKAKRLTQTAVAKAVGISVSYLNLIEHDKRPIAGALLNRLAETLDLDADTLSGLEDARLIQNLADLASEPLFRDLPLSEAGAQQIVNREPDWGRAVVRLHNAWRNAGDLIDALSDQLNRNPFVTETSHEILSQITSIRSLSEILEDHAELNKPQRTRFIKLLAQESRKLGNSATTLFQFLSDQEQESRPSTPAAEVDDFLIDHDNHFPAMEDAADALRDDIDPSGRLDAGTLIAYIAKRFGVATQFGEVPPDPDEHPISRRNFSLQATGGPLVLETSLPGSTVRFQLARAIFQLGFGELLARVAAHKNLTTDDARNRARLAMARYGAGALLLPYVPFLQAAEMLRYDIQVLGSRFGVSFEQVCHRLVTLKRAKAKGIPFAFMRADPAGNTSKRFSLTDLRLPRHASACPLWAIYRAFQTPGLIIPQLIELPDERSFLLIARTVSKDAGAFGVPQQINSVMLACNAAFADQIVYGDAFGVGGRHPATRAGISCRLCPRPECPQRAHAQIIPAVRASGRSGTP